MNRDRNNLVVPDSDCDTRLDDCLRSPICADCPIRERYQDITTSQIKVGLITVISGLAVSSVFAVGVLIVWVFHAIHGTPMVDIPWIVTSIAGAPFAAGVITTLRIPNKARVAIAKPEDKK